MMLQEKKMLLEGIQGCKKEIMQTQKQAKVIRDNGKQIGDDIVRLNELVVQKADRNSQLQKEIALAKRDVKSL